MEALPTLFRRYLSFAFSGDKGDQYPSVFHDRARAFFETGSTDFHKSQLAKALGVSYGQLKRTLQQDHFLNDKAVSYLFDEGALYPVQALPEGQQVTFDRCVSNGQLLVKWALSDPHGPIAAGNATDYDAARRAVFAVVLGRKK